MDSQPTRPEESQLDREIREAMTRGMTQPSSDFTRELMSVIAEEEAAAIQAPRQLSNSRFPMLIAGLGVLFAIVAMLLPTSGPSSITTREVALWSATAIALVSLLAMTQARPRLG